jgi:SAM-dependent methyltransferase
MKDLDCLPIYEDTDLYELEFATRDHEVPFFTKWCGGPAFDAFPYKKEFAVCEIACGTGRITFPVAQSLPKHVPFVGIDVSEPMLRKAIQRDRETFGTAQRIQWLHQDCRFLSVPQHKFSHIFMATNALQHLHDRASLDSFLQV